MTPEGRKHRKTFWQMLIAGSETGISSIIHFLSSSLLVVMPQLNLLELAKQGNVKAIARLMNPLNPRALPLSKLP